MDLKNLKNLKSVGSVDVSESMHGAFIAKNTRLYSVRDALALRGEFSIAPGEWVAIVLNVTRVDGESSGDLSPGGFDIPYSFYEHGGDGFLDSYKNEVGSYNMVYIPGTQHVTGSAEFTATVKGVQQKFKYTFNISGLDS